jgi:fluoride exporter
VSEALHESPPLRYRGRHGRLLLAVAAGGVVGCLCRAGLEKAFPVGAHGWPWATFVANIAGTIVLGCVATRLPPASVRRSLLGPGFCGAFTTFSTLQLEVLELLRHHRGVVAVAYLATSIVAGLAAVHLATVLTRRTRLR